MRDSVTGEPAVMHPIAGLTAGSFCRARETPDSGSLCRAGRNSRYPAGFFRATSPLRRPWRAFSALLLALLGDRNVDLLPGAEVERAGALPGALAPRGRDDQVVA